MKQKYLIAIVFLISILAVNIYGKERESGDIIKIGVYETYPYYHIDSNGNVSGYYHDLLMLLQEQYPFQYEYVIYDFPEGLSELKEGNIDIMLGVSVTFERLQEIIYNRQAIATENFALFSNDESVQSVNDIDEIKLGLVEGSRTVQIALNYFSNIGVDVDPIFVSSWSKLEKLFEEGEIDIMPHNATIKKEGYHKIYEFSGDQVFIAANKNNRDILESMDEAITVLRNQKIDPIQELYKKYFIDEDELILKEISKFGIPVILILLILSIYSFYGRKKLKEKKIKEKIRFNMGNSNYLLQYQPIYNPKNGRVVGFEGLLRLLGEDKKLISPCKFIPEIEDNNMLFEVSLWILERAIKEYDQIKYYDCVKDTDFYISVNVSLKEIENSKFIDEASKLLAQSKLGSNKICLEIVERIKVNDLNKVAKNLKILKEAGFKIAIDDFGTEYSNLDRLLNLETNIIKIDKVFVEGIDKDVMKNEIINFISRIAEAKNKDVVLEGIEEKAEALVIKNIDKNHIYVQGYYYNKPLFKEEIKFI